MGHIKEYKKAVSMSKFDFIYNLSLNASVNSKNCEEKEWNPLRPTVFFKMLLLLYLHEYGKSGGSVFHTNDCEASLKCCVESVRQRLRELVQVWREERTMLLSTGVSSQHTETYIIQSVIATLNYL